VMSTPYPAAASVTTRIGLQRPMTPCPWQLTDLPSTMSILRIHPCSEVNH